MSVVKVIVSQFLVCIVLLGPLHFIVCETFYSLGYLVPLADAGDQGSDMYECTLSGGFLSSLQAFSEAHKRVLASGDIAVHLTPATVLRGLSKGRACYKALSSKTFLFNLAPQGIPYSRPPCRRAPAQRSTTADNNDDDDDEGGDRDGDADLSTAATNAEAAQALMFGLEAGVASEAESKRAAAAEEENPPNLMRRSRRLKAAEADGTRPNQKTIQRAIRALKSESATLLGPELCEEELEEEVAAMILDGCLNLDQLGQDPLSPRREAAFLAVPTTQQLTDALQLWQQQVDISLKTLTDRSSSLESMTVGENKELSLVLVDDIHGARVLYVSWANPDELVGRPVRLDAHDRVVYSIASMCPLMYFKKLTLAKVLHPAVGVRMQKVKGGDRPTVPGPILRIYGMFQAAIDSSETLIVDDAFQQGAAGLETLADLENKPCALCQAPGGNRTCALCLLPWHQTCLPALISHAEFRPVPEWFRRGHLSDEFNDKVLQKGDRPGTWANG